LKKNTEGEREPLVLSTGIRGRGANPKVLQGWKKESLILLAEDKVRVLPLQGIREVEGELCLIFQEETKKPLLSLIHQSPEERAQLFLKHSQAFIQGLEQVENFPQYMDPRALYGVGDELGLLSQGLLKILATHSPVFQEDNIWHHPQKSGSSAWSWSLTLDLLRAILPQDPFQGKNILRNIYERPLPDPSRSLRSLEEPWNQVLSLGLEGKEDFFHAWSALRSHSLPRLSQADPPWRRKLKVMAMAQDVRFFLRSHQHMIHYAGIFLVIIVALSLLIQRTPQQPRNTSAQRAVETYYQAYEEQSDGPMRAVYRGEENQDIEYMSRMYVEYHVLRGMMTHSTWLSPDQWALLSDSPIENPYFVFGIRDLKIEEISQNHWQGEYEKWVTVFSRDQKEVDYKTFQGSLVQEQLFLEEEEGLWYIQKIEREEEVYEPRTYRFQDLEPIDWTVFGLDGPPGLP